MRRLRNDRVLNQASMPSLVASPASRATTRSSKRSRPCHDAHEAGRHPGEPMTAPVTDDSGRIVQKLWSTATSCATTGCPTRTTWSSSPSCSSSRWPTSARGLTGEEQAIPEGYRWADLAEPADGRRASSSSTTARRWRKLGEQGGMLGLIFRKAQNKIQDPAKLRRLIVELIGKEKWLGDVRRREGRRLRGSAGAERPGHEGRRRPVLHAAPAHRAIVDCVQPQPGEVDRRPGLRHRRLPARRARLPRRPSYELDRDQKRHLRFDALRGVEMVAGVARLCAMNLFLHGIGPDGRRPRAARSGPTTPCATSPAEHVDVVSPIRRSARSRASRSSTRRARPTGRRSPTTARTSGPRPRTSSSTSSST